MKKAKDCENMIDIRGAIDEIDNKIVELISIRSGYVHEAAKFKKDEKAVRDLDRVKKVIKSKRELAIKYGASPELIGNLYSMMIDYFVSEELKEWKTQ
jgi:isochorismate pyruvate lyase